MADAALEVKDKVAAVEYCAATKERGLAASERAVAFSEGRLDGAEDCTTQTSPLRAGIYMCVCRVGVVLVGRVINSRCHGLSQSHLWYPFAALEGGSRALESPLSRNKMHPSYITRRFVRTEPTTSACSPLLRLSLSDVGFLWRIFMEHPPDASVRFVNKGAKLTTEAQESVYIHFFLFSARIRAGLNRVPSCLPRLPVLQTARLILTVICRG